MEVPTVVSFSSLQRTAEQSIDIPGTRRRRGRGGGPSRFCTQDTVFTASVGEQIADIPVFARWSPRFSPKKRVQELHPQVLALRKRLLLGVFRTFSRSEKMCGGPAASAEITRQVIYPLPESSRTPAHGLRRLMARALLPFDDDGQEDFFQDGDEEDQEELDMFDEVHRPVSNSLAGRPPTPLL